MTDKTPTQKISFFTQLAEKGMNVVLISRSLNKLEALALEIGKTLLINNEQFNSYLLPHEFPPRIETQSGDSRGRC